jgi:hypothetical protein
LCQVSLCRSGWPGTCNPPGSASKILELQACTTIPGLKLHLNKYASHMGLGIRSPPYSSMTSH